MKSSSQELSGWGLYPKAACQVLRPERVSQLTPSREHYLARGLGRSYGDASLNSFGKVILMERLNRMIDFNEKTGVVKAEAGVTIEDLITTFVPRGWFPPVTPGTKEVTLGGCFACDVHGKNHHHAGSFAQHVKEITILLPDHQTIKCSPKVRPEIFWATAGGMGLTGIIQEVTLQMIPIQTAFVKVHHHAAKNLNEMLDILSDPQKDDLYSVAWIDCLAKGESLGRGVVMNGHHALLEDLPKGTSPLKQDVKKGAAIPFYCPSWLMGKYGIKAFNSLYYHFQSGKKSPFITDLDSFFYPLDAIRAWNKLYGKKGFLQYQCVFPHATAREGLHKILSLFSASGTPSFLAVLKRFGPENPGYLSFPKAGFTLALDIPMRAIDTVLPLLELVDNEVIKQKGRVYLAKDARLSPESFRAMYPRFADWREEKRKIDPRWLQQSDLSRRLKMEELS